MKHTLFTYKEYKEYPRATSISHAISLIGFILGIIALIGCFFICLQGGVFIAVGIAVYALIFVLLWKGFPAIERKMINKAIQEDTPRSQIKISNSADKSDYQVLMDAQAHRRASKNLLALGKNSREFRQAAKDAGITPDELVVICKRYISDYDELHRKYNEKYGRNIPYPND